MLEAAIRIELMNKAFAELCLSHLATPPLCSVVLRGNFCRAIHTYRVLL